MGDFTLYFLAFDLGQNYKEMSTEEKDKARFAREGMLSWELFLFPLLFHFILQLTPCPNTKFRNGFLTE